MNQSVNKKIDKTQLVLCSSIMANYKRSNKNKVIETAAEQRFFSENDQLILLQPPIHKTDSVPATWLSKLALRHASERQLLAYFTKKNC